MPDREQLEKNAPELSIQILGGFSVAVGGNRLPDSTWKLKKAKSIVKLLAISPASQVHRDVALDTLWPELEPDAALNNLHKTLYVARRALEPGVSGPGRFIRFQGDTIGLEIDGDESIDAQRFEARAEAARSSGDPSAYRAALDEYQGELLPEDRYEEWSIPRRDELAQAFQSLLSEYADLAESAGETDEAVSALQKLISAEPSLESAHLRLMRLYANSGNRHQAIRQYQSLARTLQSEFGLEPEEAVTAFYREIVGGRTSFQAPPAVETRQTPAVIDVQRFSPSGAPLVGRDSELTTVGPAIADLAEGKGTVILISGPAGVGKSRFAREVAAKASGAHVMQGAAYEFERQLPYGPFSEALDSFVSSLPDSQQRAIADSVPVEIYPLLPQTATRLGRAREVTDGHDRAFLFSAVDALLASITHTGPAVIILDDMHAADESTIELFHYLARQSSNVPLLLLVTYRSEGEALGSSFARALAALNRIGVGSQMTLSQLDTDAVGAVVTGILDGKVSDETISSISARAEGNPLYAEEITRAMVETGSLEKQDESWKLVSPLEEVPQAISSLLNDRIERLADGSRQLLSVASVIGIEAPYPLLRSASGVDEDAVLDALDELLQRHMLAETDDGYRFSHGLHRDVAYESMNMARRRKVHTDVAESILALYPTATDEHAESLAHHLVEAGEPVKAIPHLVTAGHRASEVFANEEALDSFSRARAILQDEPSALSPAEQGALLDAIGDVHARVGDAEQSLAHYREAMAVLEPVDPMAGFKARGKAALAAINAEQVEEGEALLESILANISPEMPDFAVARTYLLLAQIGWHSSDHDGAIESAEKALNAALSSGDDAEAARAYEAMALSCHSLGDWQKGIEYELSRAEKAVPGFDTDTAFDAHL